MSVRPFPGAHPAESAAKPGPTVFGEHRFQFIIWLRKTNQKFVDLNAELIKQKTALPSLYFQDTARFDPKKVTMEM